MNETINSITPAIIEKLCLGSYFDFFSVTMPDTPYSVSMPSLSRYSNGLYLFPEVMNSTIAIVINIILTFFIIGEVYEYQNCLCKNYEYTNIILEHNTQTPKLCLPTPDKLYYNTYIRVNDIKKIMPLSA